MLSVVVLAVVAVARPTGVQWQVRRLRCSRTWRALQVTRMTAARDAMARALEAVDE